MLWEPTASVDVANVACAEALRVPVPMVVAPSLKVMVPVATLEPPETVAVNVTVSPKTEGFLLEVNAVVVGQATCAIVAVNGVLVRPVVVMFLISTPGASPYMLDPTRKRTSTVFPA